VSILKTTPRKMYVLNGKFHFHDFKIFKKMFQTMVTETYITYMDIHSEHHFSNVI
jgi:hypothetical protein